MRSMLSLRRRRFRRAPSAAAFALAAALLAAAALPAAAAPGPLLNSGHAGQITDLQYDAPRRLLFSAGEDGSIRVWDHRDRGIVQHLRLGVQRVERIVLQPEGTLLAAVQRAPGGGALLEVWEWRSGRRRYRRALAEPPLHVGFTSRGTALVYSSAQLDGVVFLDAATGRRQRRLPPGLGIVSFVTTSTNERTIMTYEPTGRIRYWDAAGGGLQAEVATLPGLEQIAVSADKTLLVARSGEEIVAADVVTGQVRRRVTPAAGALFTVAERQAELILLEPAPEESGGGLLLRRVRLDRAVTGAGGVPVELDEAVSAIAAAGNSIFLAQPGGIAEYRPPGVVRTFARDELLPEAQLAIAGDTLVVATAERFALLRAALPGAAPAAATGAPLPGAPRLPQVLSERRLANPLRAAAGLTVVPPAAAATAALPAPDAAPPARSRHLVLAWNREGEAGAVGTLDPLTGAFEYRLAGLPAPLLRVSVVGRQLLLLDRDGEIRLYDLVQVLGAALDRQPQPEQRFPVPGAGAVAGSAHRLFAGRGSAAGAAAPLLQIDAATAETILLADEALLIYDLAQHAGGDLLTLGVEPAPAAPGQTRTVLKRRPRYALSRPQVLAAHAGEDLFAALAAAPDGRRVYSSLGLDTVRVWDGRSLDALEPSGRRPRQLAVAGGVLAARNADGTFTFWDRASGAVLFDLYLFRGFDWLAVEPGGRYAHSSGARRYLGDDLRRWRAAAPAPALAAAVAEQIVLSVSVFHTMR